MMAAPIFALSGVFAHATFVAWPNFFGFELVPWALVGIRAAVRGSVRGAVLSALAMSWMVGFGGTYTAPLTLLAAAFEVGSMLVVDLRRPGRLGRLTQAAWMGITVALLAASVSMARLWPVAENLQASPRLLGGTPGTSPSKIFQLLFGDKDHHWARGDFLIGLPALPVIAFGIFRKRAIVPLIGLVLWLWFATGYDVHASLFAVLRTIPPYTMLRAPERFLTFVALTSAVIAALGIRKLEALGRRRAGYLACAFALHGLLAIDAVLLAYHGQMRADARKMDPPPAVIARDFRQARGNRWLADYYPLMSRGTLTCFDDYDVAQTSALRGDLPQEEYLKDTDAGTVRRTSWSPNKVALHVVLTRPARVYVNQNWHPGWRASVGEVVPEDGLLAVDLAAGTHDLTLQFRPRSAIAGLWISFLGLVVAAGLLVRARKSDRVTSTLDRVVMVCAAAAPLLLLPAALRLMHEPKRPPAPLQTPAGEPMIVDAPPEDTTPIGTRLESGIVLLAAHVELEPADEDHGPFAIVELDWRFDEPVPPGLGVFIQVEAGKTHFGTDHVLLSGVLLPESAPLHTILRDISEPIALPTPKQPTTWSFYVGFWRARRDMSRLRITEVGQGTVRAGRILAGTLDVAP